jgi:hypothetical protein
LVQAGQSAVLTDGEGRFEFRDVIEGAFPVANKPGYFAETGSAAGVSPTNSDNRSLELRLVPEAIVSGRVTDTSGAPIEGVSVMLRSLSVSNGLKHWEQRSGTTTNAEGEFRIAELQAGEYALQTALKLDGPSEGEAAAGYVASDYPALGVNGAGALQVHPGDHLEAEISTRLERLYPISVQVSGLPGNSWPNFTVRTAGGVEVNPSLQQNPQTGQFRMLLPSGSFDLRAQAYVQPELIQTGGQGTMGFTRNRAPLQFIARQAVTVAEGPVRVRMSFEPMAAVPVEVAEEKTGKSQANDPPSAQFNFSLLPAEADAAPIAYPAESMSERAGSSQALQTDGPRVIRNLPPGQYVLQAPGQLPWYVSSAVCGGTDLMREPLVIAGSAAGCTMRVVLRDDAASLQIAVSDAGGRESASVNIYLIPLNNTTRDVQITPAGADGNVSFNAAPGQYLALATRETAQLAFRDAENLRRYEAEGKRIDLSPGENAKLQLDVITGEP